jgi:anti-anti-sigma regulatory factor
LDEAAAASGPFVVDMTSLRFIDSVGICALLKVAAALEEAAAASISTSTTARSAGPWI